ncbi:hypothetical protein C9I86_13200 [Photobacterium sp. NCIMB 13483]|nr:hypothetical protein C9I86_13200 [Photobacterium sp. NCIMB 13483]
MPMFEKGRSFVAAAGLLKAYDGHKLVSAHLLCQGFECIGKYLLLKKDYEQYNDKLRKEFGHDLIKLLKEINELYGSELFNSESKNEVDLLNDYYIKHDLRYGSPIDFKSVDTSISFHNIHSDLISILNNSNELVEKNLKHNKVGS